MMRANEVVLRNAEAREEREAAAKADPTGEALLVQIREKLNEEARTLPERLDAAAAKFTEVLVAELEKKIEEASNGAPVIYESEDAGVVTRKMGIFTTDVPCCDSCGVNAHKCAMEDGADGFTTAELLTGKLNVSKMVVLRRLQNLEPKYNGRDTANIFELFVLPSVMQRFAEHVVPFGYEPALETRQQYRRAEVFTLFVNL